MFVDLYEKERALRESERRFRTAFEHAPIGVALLTLDGRFVDANRALTTMLGRSAADLLAQENPLELVHQDDRAAHAEHLARLSDGREHRLQPRGRASSGRTASPCRRCVAASLVPDEDGNPLHTIVQVEDLTERRAAERERDRRQLEETARREAEAVASTLSKLQSVTDVALAHLGVRGAGRGPAPADHPDPRGRRRRA